MKILKAINDFEEYGEMALLDLENDEIILKGDSYHDHISDMIAGFLYCLEYYDIDYNVKEVRVTEEMSKKEPYKQLDFYYE